MSIIGKVGRKSSKIRALNLSIHLILLLGAITMIYPFLLMLSSSVKSAVDSQKMSLLPDYLYNDKVLFRKYLESRYNEESSRLADNYPGLFNSFNEVEIPTQPDPAIYKLWKEFLQEEGSEFGVYDYYVAEQYGRGVYPLNQRAMREVLRKENGNNLTNFNNRYGLGVQSWEQIVIEEKDIVTRNYHSGGDGYLGRYERFKEQIELRHRNYINFDGNFAVMELIPAFNGDLKTFNQAMGTTYASWTAVTLPSTVPPEGSPLRPLWIHYVQSYLNVHHVVIADYKLLKHTPSGTALHNEDDYTYLVENLAVPEDLEVRSLNNSFRNWLSEKYPAGSESPLAKLGRYPDFGAVKLSEGIPKDNIYAKEDWLEFAVGKALRSLELKPGSQQDFIQYLKGFYALPDSTLDIAKLNRELHTRFESELNLYPAKTLPEGKYGELWIAFIRKANPVHLQLKLSPELQSAYSQYLKTKYGSIDTLNLGWGMVCPDPAAYPLPIQQIEYQLMQENKGKIKWEFVKRNYAMVLDQMLNDARSLRNTLIYCFLSILVAITVNPLAAYALSRFKPRLSYQLIMLFMLTMAFPAMVMGIPNFLMLKKLNLLNTFWALILPAAADGYFIFLLKGFFDSLPKELYESAQLDGAGEFRLFWQFTLYLSKPILAVIALGAFNAAYRNFLFAFIICQDQSMWTLMVHIYQLMQRASLNVGYAALVIAAIPTLAIFIFFQNIIIKGIVVPMEK